MLVKDKTIKTNVDVSDAQCLTRPCYWPRSDPGVFVQGQGYRHQREPAVWAIRCMHSLDARRRRDAKTV
jgi:hypothetical protein